MNFKKVTLLSLLSASIAVADVGLLTKVVDGDTAHFGDVKCRFAYIDTPESKLNDKVKKDASACNGMTPERMVDAGKKSSNFTKAKLNVGQTYKYDVVDTDRYGRSVCIIEAGGSSINLSIVAEGYAVPFEQYIDDPKVKRAFLKAAQEAKQNNRGLWNTHKPVMQCMSGR